MTTTAAQPAAAATPFAVQKTKAPTTVLELLNNDSFRAEITKVLPKHLPAERMLRVALTTAKTNDKIAKANMASFAAAMMKCSQYGLEPDGRHAHLIPFKNGKDGTYDIQLIFDYKGLASLVRRSGDVSDIHCDVVYEADEFECSFGDGGRLFHKPNLKASRDERGDIVCAYSFVKLKDGSVSYEPMAMWEILDVMENSQGYQAFKKGFTKSNPWDSNFGEMAKKTAFRRHTKWLPLSPENKDAINADDDISEESRFERARKVSATVVAPDFSMPADPQALSDSPESPSAAAGGTGPTVATSPPEAPNPVLGEKPARRRKSTSGPAGPADTEPPTPEATPTQTQEPTQPAPAPPQDPAAIVKPTPNDQTRLSMVVAIRDALPKCGVTELSLMNTVIAFGFCPPGTVMTQLTSETLGDIVADWPAIIERARDPRD